MSDIKTIEMQKRCRKCNKPIEKPVKRRITQRYSGRVITSEIEFCSEICGEHYQMGCEG